MLELLLFMLIALLYLLLFKNKMKIGIIKIKKLIPMSIILFVIIGLIIFSEEMYLTAKEAFMLWVNNIIPSLFPFFICIELLKSTPFIKIVGRLLNPIMRPLFNVPGAGAIAIALGITSGYPVGAKLSAELYESGDCTKEEAERLLSFTNTSGPLFIIGAVGVGMLGNQQIGILLLLTHFLGSLTVGLIFRNYKNNKSIVSVSTAKIIPQDKSKINSTLTVNNLGKYMGEAIQKSIESLLIICGYIVFFAIISSLAKKVGIIDLISKLIAPIFKALSIPRNFRSSIITGIIEVTNGIKILSKSITTYDIVGISIVAFLLGFGGISVFMQTASITAKTNLSLVPYIIGKIFHGSISSLYTYLILRYTNFFSNKLINAFSYSNTTPAIINETSNILSALLTVLLIGIVVKAITFILKKAISTKEYFKE